MSRKKSSCCAPACQTVIAVPHGRYAFAFSFGHGLSCPGRRLDVMHAGTRTRVPGGRVNGEACEETLTERGKTHRARCDAACPRPKRIVFSRKARKESACTDALLLRSS